MAAEIRDGGADAPAAATGRSRRLLAVLAVALVPWTVVSARGTITLVTTVGLVGLDPLGLTSILDYYFRYTVGLPRFLLAWGVGVLLYALAAGSALLGLAGREDARVTASLLALAGATNLWVALGFLRRPGYLVLPVGTLACWLVVWWCYRGDLRRALSPGGRGPR